MKSSTVAPGSLRSFSASCARSASAETNSELMSGDVAGTAVMAQNVPYF